MNTTTDRHSRSYHARQINNAMTSASQADRALAALVGALTPELSCNSYFTDMLDRARSLANEMAADVDDVINNACADGFGYEDFSA